MTQQVICNDGSYCPFGSCDPGACRREGKETFRMLGPPKGLHGANLMDLARSAEREKPRLSVEDREMCEQQQILNDPDSPELLKSLVRPSGLTDFGRMNRALRVYFQITMSEQANDLSLKTSQLSGYETGRIDLPDGVKRSVILYWQGLFTRALEKTA